MSIASSAPASQLLTSQNDDEDNSQTTTANGGSQHQQPIAPARLLLFRTALGQLVNTPLFQNESADLEPLVGAVNERLARRGDAEERNEIM